MREWAIDVINGYSKVKLSDKVKEELEKNPFPETVSWAWPSGGTATGTLTTSTEGPWSSYWRAAYKMLGFNEVEIKSQPLGASIYVDGRFMGLTNNIILIPPGEHEVKLKLNDKERIIKIKPSETSTVNIDFDK